MEEVKISEGSEDEEGYDNAKENPDELGKSLIKNAANGNLNEVISLLKRKADVNYQDKKGWSALMWSSSQGHVDVVIALINHGASIVVPEQLDKVSNTGFNTPLHWATFNGHIEVIWVLIKKGFNYNEVDRFGNNCIHHAVASSRVDILETFLAFGVAGDHKNSRGHQPIQLTSDETVKSILNSAIKARKCKMCGSVFDLRNTRHLCQVCKRYFCRDCKTTTWMFIKPESTEENMPVCRCSECQSQIDKAEIEMNEKIEMNKLEDLSIAIAQVRERGVIVDPKLLEKARIEQERLRTEGSILKYIDSLAYVENYKTIQKSVFVLKGMLEDATKRGVEIDEKIILRADKECARLISERNLRYQVDIINPSEASSEVVMLLEDLAGIAEVQSVSNDYIDAAKVIILKMKENIEAHYILRLFLDYPLRDYPEPVLLDSRGRKIPPKASPAKEEAKKVTKKKKEPKFLIPDWATELSALITQVENLDKLTKKAQHLELTQDFLDQAKENLIRMKKEINFRKQQEEELRQIAEKKAADKKKNKNK
jgi:Ankyrin repeats (3 copies)